MYENHKRFLVSFALSNYSNAMKPTFECYYLHMNMYVHMAKSTEYDCRKI